MNENLLIAICLFLMVAFLSFRRKLYNVAIVKIAPLAICVAVLGLLGTYILYYIENGIWYGRSFWGAVLFFPILLLPVAWIFKMTISDLLGYSTVPGVALLAVYKWNCWLEGCCGGRVMWFSEDGIPTHFPSQIVEMTVAILITVVLLTCERKEKMRTQIYPIFLILYGTTRCVLNYFRWEQQKFLLGLTAGAFWSVIAVLIGITWMIVSGILARSKE